MTEILVFFDKRFVKQAIQELKLMLSGDYTIKSYISDSIIVVSTGMEYEDIAKNFLLSAPVFIDRVSELNEIIGVKDGYSALVDALHGIIEGAGKKAPKIEVLKEYANDQRHAKDIEVELGLALETREDIPNLKNPDIMLYVILKGDKAYVFMGDFRDAYGSALDHFRHRNMDAEVLENRISRAEFKVYEAVNYFGIKLEQGMRALDIGAAPGGWTRYLIKNGLRVVAIDAGNIDYAKMPKGIRMAIAPGENREAYNVEGIDILAASELEGRGKDYELLHIKELFGRIKLSTLVGLGPFDILCIDINIPAQEAAVIAAVCSEALKAKGKLILTLKMTDDNIERNVEKSKEALAATYDGIRVKKLPHDRKELTLFAIKI